MNDNDSKAKRTYAANRSFNSIKNGKDKYLKRQRSQSYTEGKVNIDIKKCIQADSNGICSSDEQQSRNYEDGIQTKVDNSILDDVVREGRYFLGENLGRITQDIDGSRHEIDTLEDDQLEWDNETEFTTK